MIDICSSTNAQRVKLIGDDRGLRVAQVYLEQIAIGHALIGVLGGSQQEAGGTDWDVVVVLAAECAGSTSKLEYRKSVGCFFILTMLESFFQSPMQALSSCAKMHSFRLILRPHQ